MKLESDAVVLGSREDKEESDEDFMPEKYLDIIVGICL
jgi:hypothetical protein